MMEHCSECDIYFPEDEAYGTSEEPLCSTCGCEPECCGQPVVDGFGEAACCGSPVPVEVVGKKRNEVGEREDAYPFVPNINGF